MSLPVEFLALRERFIARLPERLANVRRLLQQLEAGSDTALPEIRRAMHSLVGAAGLHELVDIARQAGTIEALAESGAGSGALATAIDSLELLIRPSTASPPQSAQDAAPAAAIALLSENREDRISQATLLRGTGYRVDEFSQFSALLAALASGSQYDLLLLGLLFAGDDQAGVAYIQQLRQQRFTAPIVVVSANRSLECRLAAHKAGADSILLKPLSAQQLLRSVDEALVVTEDRPLAVLALATAADGLQQVVGTTGSSLLEVETCVSTAQLRDRLAARRYDALLLQDNLQDEATTTALITMLHTDPDTAALPLVLCTGSANAARQARALAAGCRAVVDASWQPAELSALIASLCRLAVRQQADAERVQRKAYEFGRQSEAIGEHAIISLADSEGNVKQTSARHSVLTGHARTELIGANLFRQRPGYAAPEFNAAIAAQVSNGELWQGEYALATTNDKVAWVSSTLVPFLDAAGNIYQYMVIRTDVTARKRSEDNLSKSRASQLAVAAQIQETLLLPPLPACPAGIPLASMFAAADGVAGDFHALTLHNSHCFDLMVGDVMGKGMAAALVGAAVKMEYGHCLRELDKQQHGQLPEPAAIVAALRRRLTPRLIALECFVTLTYIRFDRQRRVLTSVGCGHPEILLVADSGTRSLPNQQLPLGLVDSEEYGQTETAWEDGASVVVYSDGLSEAVAADGNMLETGGLVRIVEASRALGRHPAITAEAVARAIGEFTGDTTARDDRSLVAVYLPADSETCLELDNSLTAIRQLQATVQQVFATTLSAAELDRLMLAAVEAFTNIVRHGNSPSERIALKLKQGPPMASVTFCYHGVAFSPRQVAALPEPEQLGESGLGLMLIHALCDDVEYDHQSGVNIMRLGFCSQREKQS